MSTRPDLAGSLLRDPNPNLPGVYLIDDDGIRRLVPDPATLNNLFTDSNHIIPTIDLNTIDEGSHLTSGAILARGINTNGIFLITNGQKRLVTSPQAMDKFHFAFNKVKEVPVVLLDSIPEGPDIS
jgi:hypothetical protein